MYNSFISELFRYTTKFGKYTDCSHMHSSRRRPYYFSHVLPPSNPYISIDIVCFQLIKDKLLTKNNSLFNLSACWLRLRRPMLKRPRSFGNQKKFAKLNLSNLIGPAPKSPYCLFFSRAISFSIIHLIFFGPGIPLNSILP